MDTVTEQQLDEYINSVCRTDAIRQPLRRHLLNLRDKIIADARAKAAEAKRHGFQHPPIPTMDKAMDRVLWRFGKAIKSQYALKQLVKITDHFLAFIDWLGRPLLLNESKPWRFLLLEWESASIKAETMRSSDDDKEYYRHLMAQLREVFCPDPVCEIDIRRVVAEHVAEKHGGNNATVSKPLNGVSTRRMTTRDVMRRVHLIRKLIGNIHAVAHELSNVRKSDRDEVKQIKRASSRFIKLAQGFATKCEHTRKPTPTKQLSPEEAVEKMKNDAKLSLEAAVEKMKDDARLMSGCVEAMAG